jgi:hypothetical protein
MLGSREVVRNVKMPETDMHLWCFRGTVINMQPYLTTCCRGPAPLEQNRLSLFLDRTLNGTHYGNTCSHLPFLIMRDRVAFTGSVILTVTDTRVCLFTATVIPASPMYAYNNDMHCIKQPWLGQEKVHAWSLNVVS